MAAAVGGLFKNMRAKVPLLRYDSRESLCFFDFVQADMMVDNLSINGNVLRCAQEMNCVKVVSMNSTCVFPDKVALFLVLVDTGYLGTAG